MRPASERGRILQRDREEIAVMESLDTSKTIEEGRIDVADVTAVFRHYVLRGRWLLTLPG